MVDWKIFGVYDFNIYISRLQCLQKFASVQSISMWMGERSFWDEEDAEISHDWKSEYILYPIIFAFDKSVILDRCL